MSQYYRQMKTPWTTDRTHYTITGSTLHITHNLFDYGLSTNSLEIIHYFEDVFTAAAITPKKD